MSITVAAANQTLSNALAALNAVRERAKSSKDSDLKNHVSSLYDSMLDLKEVLLRVMDENATQARRIAELEQPAAKPELRQVGATNYYFVGNVGPYCQACYDVGPERRLIRLSPQQTYNGGIRRQCVVCKQYFKETSDDDDEPAFAIG